MGLKFWISWQVPAVGENEIGAHVFGNSLAPARIVTHKGVGSTAVHMRYEVYPREIPWQHRVPVPGQEPVAPNTSPTSWYTTPENVQHIAYVGEDQQIHELYLFVRVGGDFIWHHSVPGAGQIAVAQGTSPTSWYTRTPIEFNITPNVFGGRTEYSDLYVQHIAYVGTDERIHELFYFIRVPFWVGEEWSSHGDGIWVHWATSDRLMRVALGTSPTSWYTTPENVQHITYVGADRRIHELSCFIR